MSVTLKKKPVMHEYSFSDKNINCVYVQKDLGIFTDSKLTFVHYVSHLVKKGNRMTCLEFHNFHSCKNEQLLRTIYCTLIRPNLEYCTVVFNSILKSQSDRLERVQRRFLFFMFRSLLGTDRVSHLNDNPNYLQLCHLFNLPTLYDRRIVNDCVFLYKHTNNCYNLTDANPFSLHVPQCCTKSAANHIVHIPWSRVEATKQGFVSSISSTYNLQPTTDAVFVLNCIKSCGHHDCIYIYP